MFLSTLWGNEANIVYVAYGKRGTDGKINGWEKAFYSWPDDKITLLADIERRKPHEEVYFCPALYSRRDAHKDAVRGATCVWVDFDGNAPIDLKGIPAPTIKVQSSDPGHEHWYWKLDSECSVEVVERINRSFVYLFSADNSGWDASQLLRPPNTFNHKRRRNVELIEFSPQALPVGLFMGLPEAPPLQEVALSFASESDIPDINDVVFKYEFPDHVKRLFTSAANEGTRSTGLMNLAYSFCEMPMNDQEVYAMLDNVAHRWGKFDGRTDRNKRINELITIARQKYPYRVGQGTHIQLIGFKSLLASEVHLEWVWQGWLQEGGLMLLTGQPGIGKTQVSLDVAGHFALGKDVLGQTVTRPRKIGFLSLEMNLPDIKEFLMVLAAAFTPEEQEILEQNLLILPLGESLFMNRLEIREQIEKMIVDYGLEGIFIDSLTSTIEGDVASSATKELLEWSEHVRNKYGCFWWVIHHQRKATGENKKPNKLDDVFGGYYVTGKAHTVFVLWETAVQNAIEVLPLKVRMSKRPERFYITRGPNLHFERVSSAAITMAASSTRPKSVTVVEDGEEQPKKGMAF